MAGLGLAKKVGLTALGLASGGAAGNYLDILFHPYVKTKMREEPNTKNISSEDFWIFVHFEI